jgi:hypothetical protein
MLFLLDSVPITPKQPVKADAVATTAQNPSGIGPYTGGFSDPPTQAEMQDFAAYVESLRAALVR